MIRIAAVTAMGIFALAATSHAFDDDEIKAAWVVKPPVFAEMSASDQQARTTLLDLLTKKQDADYRKSMRVEVPERASGLSADYDVLMYGMYAGSAHDATRLEVRVRGDQATLEHVSAGGIYRAQLPAAKTDQLVRRLAFAFYSQEVRRETEDLDLIVGPGAMFATHVPHVTLEVVSRDKQHPFHLKTSAWQPIADNVSHLTNGVRGFAHNALCSHLYGVTRDRWDLIPVAEENAEIVRRLKLVSADKVTHRQVKDIKEELPVNHYLRKDLAAVEAQLYSCLAVKRALPAAEPELQRLGMKDELPQLQIAIAADPRPLIQKALVGQEWSLYYWSLKYATDWRHPERLPWVVEVLPKIPGPYNNQQTLERLVGRKVAPEQHAAIDELFRNTPEQRTKIMAAGELLRLTNKDEYYNWLVELVKQREPSGEYSGDSTRAIAATTILQALVESGQRKPEAYALVKSLIDEKPVSATRPPDISEHLLIRYLGLLGNKDDVPILRKYADHKDDSLGRYAIDSLAHLDPALAKELIHRHIERFLEGEIHPNTYFQKVSGHFDVIAWQRDTAAIPLLTQAWARLKPVVSNDDGDYDRYYDPRPLITALEAKKVDDRLQALLQFHDHHSLDTYVAREIVKQLIAEGADEKNCVPLLVPHAERHRRGR